MSVIIGYIGAVIIGLSLGLMGGGGSILTVPVLVYLFAVDPVLATAYSLIIVGLTSSVGSFSYFRKGLVNVKTAIVFGIPSIVAVFLTRAYIIPSIPDEIAVIGGSVITKRLLIMGLFAILMILASYNMIRKKPKTRPEYEKQEFNYPLIIIEGLIVGGLTGLVGAGGGFLIIPALVLLSKLPMKEAVGTSLVIIAAKSIIGFLGENNIKEMDWLLIGSISAFAVIGIILGSLLSKRIDGKKLKPLFGWFVLAMGIYVILKETIL